jgi:hypothetical protein
VRACVVACGLWGHAYLICGAAALQVQKKLTKKLRVPAHATLRWFGPETFSPGKRLPAGENAGTTTPSAPLDEGREREKRFMAKG